MRIAFGPFQPDASTLGAQVLADVRNAIPTSSGWQPQRGLVAVTEQELAGAIQGVVTATRLSGDIELFVVADGTVWRVPSQDGALEDAGSGFSSSADDRWRFALYGDLLVGTNFTDDVQAYNLTSGGSFADLSVEAPRARYIAVVRDFIVLGHTWDSVDGTDAYRVQWHGLVDGIPDPTEWTPSLTTQADFQRIADIGAIVGLTGGETGTVIGDLGVARMSYGGAATFQFDTVERRIGCRVPNSVVQYRQATLFYSRDGWMAFDGQAVRPIGSKKIDEWFAADFDEGSANLMWAAVETGRGHVLWAYPGASHQNRCNRLLRYAIDLDEWSVSDLDLDALGPGKTYGLTLDDAYFDNLDAFTGSLDDASLWLALPQTIAIADGRISTFAGEPLTGTFQTSPMMLDQDGRRILLNRALVLHQGGTPSLRVGTTDRFDASTVTWTGDAPQQSDGFVRFRAAGRSHRLRVSLTGQWSAAQGLEVTGTPIGLR